MSIQPSPNSDKDKHDIWRDLLTFADILYTEFNFQSLLVYIEQLFWREYRCRCKVWLSPAAIHNDSDNTLLNDDILIKDLSPDLYEALQKKQIVFSNNQLGSANNNETGLLTIPLIIKDEELGVILLERISDLAWSAQEIESFIMIASQLSLGLGYLKNITHGQYLQLCEAERSVFEEIARSILSNLDRRSLYNNLLSLLHLQYGFLKISLVIIQGDNQNSLTHIALSEGESYTEKKISLQQVDKLLSWSIDTGMPIIHNHTELSTSQIPRQPVDAILSECAIPLFYGSDMFGAIELCSDSADVFGPATLRGLYLLVGYISTAIKNAETYHTEYIKRQISDRMQEDIGLISPDTSLDDVLQILLDEISDMLAWDAAAIWLFESPVNGLESAQDTSTVRMAAYRINDEYLRSNSENPSVNLREILDSNFDLSLSENDLISLYPWFSVIINTEMPCVRNQSESHEPLGEILGFTNDYSAFGCLLTKDGQKIGIVVLVHEVADQFDDEARIIVNTFVNIATKAILNAKLYSAAHEQAWISTVLLQVAEATQSITNINELLDTMIGMLPGLMGVGACTIFLWDPSIEAFIPSISSGLNEEQTARINTLVVFPDEVAAYHELTEHSNPIILRKELLPTEFITNGFSDYDLEKDLLVLFPLISQNNLVGSLLVDFTNSNLEKDSPQEVWDEKYTLIEGVARQLAAAIQNLQLIKAREEEAYTSIALLQVAQAIVSFNQLDEILSSIVRITPILVSLKRCIIYLWENNDQVFKQSEYYGFSKADLALLGQEIKADEFPFIEAIQAKKQILYHPLNADVSPHDWIDISTGDYYAAELNSTDASDEITIKLDSKSLINRDRLLIGFPLSVKDEILGVMLIEEEDPTRGTPSLHIREKRIEIVNGITQQAAIAIKNELLQHEAIKSERMERELQLAREIQYTFLPDKLPEIPGWEIEASWQPARQVAGDFYDIIPLKDDQIGFVIADVADKGMPAALFMILIRTLIRAATKEGLSPAAVIKQVNELLYPDSKHGMFVTVFYGVFSVNTGMLTYVNAGHNPPVVKHLSEVELIELSRTSIALGIFDQVEVEERKIMLFPGDWVLLYTDGITEAFSADDVIYGKQRLYELLLMDEILSAKDLLSKVEESVNAFINGADLSDDMTLTVIHRLPDQ